jgi:hypothetical protein
MASHMSRTTASGPRLTRVGKLMKASRFHWESKAAIRRFVPPRSTPTVTRSFFLVGAALLCCRSAGSTDEGWDSGSADGAISCVVKGTARSMPASCRIGWNVVCLTLTSREGTGYSRKSLWKNAARGSDEAEGARSHNPAWSDELRSNGRKKLPVDRVSIILIGRLAQLVRAPALQAGSRGFESLTAHQSNQ